MKLRRIGAIGDIHAESETLEKILHFFSNQNLDKILAVGDIVDGQGDVDKCCELLESFNVAAVKGNHERWFLTNDMRELKHATPLDAVNNNTIAYFENLPNTQRFETIAGPMLLCHGVGNDDMQQLHPDDFGYALESNFALQELIQAKEYSFMLGGHTHKKMVRTFDTMTVINAGTIKRSHQPCFAIIDFEERYTQFYVIDEEFQVAERFDI